MNVERTPEVNQLKINVHVERRTDLKGPTVLADKGVVHDDFIVATGNENVFNYLCFGFL